LAGLIFALSACGGAEQAQDAGPSLVRLAGTACLKPILATAVVVDRGLLLTVAHAIAGAEDDLVVIDLAGTERAVRVVAFDPEKDLALLEVAGFDEPIDLGIPEAEAGGTIAAVGRDLVVEAIPYRILREVTARSGDIYDEGKVLRQVLEIEARVGPGDSGAPLLDRSGDMVGLLFADSQGVEDSAWALHASEIKEFLAKARGGGEVDRGRCR
jgi:S1-C subfamily serine protease